MDFNDSEEQASFRAEIKQWLATNARPKKQGLMSGGQEDRFEQAVEWYHKRFDAGYSCLTWPKEYGGQGLTQMHQVIWQQEVSHYGEPDEYFVIGIGNCGPALMHYASEAVKKELLSACQFKLHSGLRQKNHFQDMINRPKCCTSFFRIMCHTAFLKTLLLLFRHSL